MSVCWSHIIYSQIIIISFIWNHQIYQFEIKYMKEMHFLAFDTRGHYQCIYASKYANHILTCELGMVIENWFQLRTNYKLEFESVPFAFRLINFSYQWPGLWWKRKNSTASAVLPVDCLQQAHWLSGYHKTFVMLILRTVYCVCLLFSTQKTDQESIKNLTNKQNHLCIGINKILSTTILRGNEAWVKNKAEINVLL